MLVFNAKIHHRIGIQLNIYVNRKKNISAFLYVSHYSPQSEYCASIISVDNKN